MTSPRRIGPIVIAALVVLALAAAIIVALRRPPVPVDLGTVTRGPLQVTLAVDDVPADYARTEEFVPPAVAERVIKHLRAQHPNNSSNLEELAAMSPARVMREVLTEVDRDYGSPVEYLRSGGLSDDEIAELRRVLVVRGS